VRGKLLRDELPREELPRDEIPRDEIPRDELPREELPKTVYKTNHIIMRIHVQKIKQDQQSKDEFLFKLPPALDTNTCVYAISKRGLCSAMQMLQKNE
jgi:hypothetical protein